MLLSLTKSGGFNDWCQLPDTNSLVPNNDNLSPSIDLATEASRKQQVERISAAVRCPTESFDDNGDVDVDPRWKTFDKFHEVLKDLFPLIHNRAKIDKVNRYGLLYTLKGTSSSLKPIMLTAHQDVVPASSLSKWTHAPLVGKESITKTPGFGLDIRVEHPRSSQIDRGVVQVKKSSLRNRAYSFSVAEMLL